MFTIRNPGQFPVFIRDLQIYVDGGKTVDLDQQIRRETSNKSADLDRLFRSKKLVLVGKDGGGEVVKKKPKKSPKQDSGGDKRDIVELKKGMMEILDFLKSGNFSPSAQNAVQQAVESKDPDTMRKIAELQANSLANQKVETSVNFDKIGVESVSSNDNVDDMLDILDNLD